MGHQPTPEQAAILSAVATGDNLVIEAGAGTGKTSTLEMIAHQAGNARVLYLAYNRSIKEEAQARFPRNTRAVTSHGLAFGPVGKKYAHRLRGGRIPARQAARVLGVNEPARLGEDAPLAPEKLVSIANSTVKRFCYSADAQITRWHVPTINGLDAPAARAALAQVVLPIAERIWADMLNLRGQLTFTHDAYLKMFQLGGPRIDCDVLMLDESQDTNPVVEAIVKAQTHAQIILVGDRCQSIYGWRGATDAMEHFDGKRLQLSQSFRFGPAVAAEANKWLNLAGGEMRLSGFDKIPSRVEELDEADAVLCRSNGMALSEVMNLTADGRRVALVGGGEDIKALAKAALDLQYGRGTSHPDLMAFDSWGAVREYVHSEEAGSDLKVLVDMVDRHGAATLIDVVSRLADERQADTVVSTAHKAKGREWNRVRVATDFRQPKVDEATGEAGRVSREDAMLAYVTVTRAKLVLDREGLAWVDAYLPGAALVAAPAAPAEEPAEAVEVDEPVEAPAAVEPLARDGRTVAEVVAAIRGAAACGRCGCGRCFCGSREKARHFGIVFGPAVEDELLVWA